MKNHQNVYRSLQATMGTVLLFFAILKITSCNSDEGAVGEPGTIQVNVSTSGVELDSDGYEIMLDGGTAMAVASNGLVTFDSVSAGAHAVSISGTRVNCDPGQGTEQNANVTSAGTTTVSFDVVCTTKPLVFSSVRSGEFRIYRMNLDGTGQVPITNDRGWGPRWSPDGQKISYEGDHNGLYVVNEDGLNNTLVLEDATWGTWSPDGQKLVTVKDGEIHTVNIDGSGLTQLTSIGGTLYDPDWGPETDPRIIFSFFKDGEDSGIFIMNADGSDLTRLTSDNDSQPAWAKDGSQIAFTRFGNGLAIFIMDFRGGILFRRTGDGVVEEAARWSPDGSELTFVTLLPGNSEVCIGSSSVPGALNLSQNINDDIRPDWRPDI